MKSGEVYSKVVNIVSHALSVKRGDISLCSLLEDDFGADSLDVIDIVMELEDEFEISIHDGYLTTVNTVGDICVVVSKVAFGEEFDPSCVVSKPEAPKSVMMAEGSDKRIPISDD